jgi:hypothetical protein
MSFDWAAKRASTRPRTSLLTTLFTPVPLKTIRCTPAYIVAYACTQRSPSRSSCAIICISIRRLTAKLSRPGEAPEGPSIHDQCGRLLPTLSFSSLNGTVWHASVILSQAHGHSVVPDPCLGRCAATCVVGDRDAHQTSSAHSFAQLQWIWPSINALERDGIFVHGRKCKYTNLFWWLCYYT